MTALALEKILLCNFNILPNNLKLKPERALCGHGPAMTAADSAPQKPRKNDSPRAAKAARGEVERAALRR
jgi:hypothetical protein